jgi:two-component system LytT family response regulator
VVGEARHGDEAIAAVAALDPDVILLDVEMPGTDGIAVARTIAAAGRPAIVFVTAFDRFAVEAFALHAVDYLLKPVDDARLATAMARVALRAAPRDDVADRDAVTRMDRLLSALGARAGDPRPSRPQHLLVRTGGSLHLVAVRDIEYCSADGNHVRLHTAAGSHLLRATLVGVEATLDPARFVRIHRSTLVALDRVASLHPLPSGDCTVRLRSGATVTLARRHRAAFEARVGLIG